MAAQDAIVGERQSAAGPAWTRFFAANGATKLTIAVPRFLMAISSFRGALGAERQHFNLWPLAPGANKLWNPGNANAVYETLVKAIITFPPQMACFVSGVEFLGGSMLAVGLLSSPACAALLIDMSVAIVANSLSTLPKGLSPSSWLDDFLYLPEALYVLFFVWLICFGPGTFSVDHWLAGKVLVAPGT